MRRLMSRFAKNETAATVVEYGLIATLLGVALIGGLTALSGSLNESMEGIADDPLWDAAGVGPAGG